MCGICGYWGIEDEKLIKSMNQALFHRGPDEDGYFFDRKIGLAVRRLRVIDLSTGKQPIHNEDKSMWIVYNGEIYNYKEIRKKLEDKGHRFYTNTDTEVIIHAYEEYGQKCLQLFNGMFAFAIWDKNKKKLFIARDRIGIKPLYYYYDKKRFLFASEIKSLLKFPVKKELDDEIIYFYLNYGSTPRNKTVFKDIKKLEPGSCLELDDSEMKISRYWKLDFSNKILKGERFFVEEIRRHLDESVKRRLIADVPVGAYLSGGLDSSAIVAFAKKHKEDIKTFSISFSDSEYDESKYSKLISEKFQTQHFCYNFDSDDVVKTLPAIIEKFDEPFADTAAIPNYILAKITRKHVTVSLSGDGADESFLGYDRYYYSKILRYSNFMPKYLNKSFYRIFRSLNKKIKKSKITTLNNYFYLGSLNEFQRYSELRSGISEDLRKNLLRRDYNFSDYFRPYFVYNNYLDNLSNFDFNEYLPEIILRKLDITTMAVSLEGRVPFLDHNFVEFSASIPSSLKLKNFETKYILKKALIGILPKEIIYRKKQGFVFPLKNYIKNQLKDYVKKELTERSSLHKYVNKHYVDDMLYSHYKNERNYTGLIWSLLILKKWLDFHNDFVQD